MTEIISETKTIEELIYAIEPLAYYFGMKPHEFWDCRYKEVNLYIQSNMVKMVDDFKREITLQEAVTDKLIRADSMTKRPKVVPLRKTFKNLFKKEPKIQSTQEQLARLRSWK